MPRAPLWPPVLTLPPTRSPVCVLTFLLSQSLPLCPHSPSHALPCGLQPQDALLQNGTLYPFFISTVKGKFNFNARDPEDLSFRKGDILNVIEKHEEQWWKVRPSARECVCVCVSESGQPYLTTSVQTDRSQNSPRSPNLIKIIISFKL